MGLNIDIGFLLCLLSSAAVFLMMDKLLLKFRFPSMLEISQKIDLIEAEKI